MPNEDVAKEAAKVRDLMQEQTVLEEALNREILEMEGVLAELPKIEVTVKTKDNQTYLAWQTFKGSWGLTLQAVPDDANENIGTQTFKISEVSTRLKAEAVGVFPALIKAMTEKLKADNEAAKNASGIKVEWNGVKGEKAKPTATSRNGAGAG